MTERLCISLTTFSLITSKPPDYELKLIGAFENAEVEIRLKQLIKELNIEDKVRFTGLIDAKELPQHLKNANVYYSIIYIRVQR